MNLAIILPVLLGAIGILQGAANRVMGNHMGLTYTMLIGNVMTLVACIILFVVVKSAPNLFPEFIQLKSFEMKWWYLIPGIMGFLFVAGLPLAFYKVGAVKTTVGLIAAQMITSSLWDYFYEGLTFNLQKGFGVIFAIISVILITLS
ncbi:MAG: hypothetical protein CME69_10605 [Halobacteriovorax sp.]|nr:hypothetical protein [Halobacteriovorax sp.]MEE3080166.1 DMT family transporter [Bdellovibrionota bacterium]